MHLCLAAAKGDLEELERCVADGQDVNYVSSEASSYRMCSLPKDGFEDHICGKEAHQSDNIVVLALWC
jgi:hypothetical protein